MGTHNTDRLNSILGLMLRSECTLEQIAAEHDLTFVALLELLRTPEAQAAIAAIEELQTIRDRLRAPVQRDAAMARLHHIATTSNDDLEARRAATTLLRARATPKPRATDLGSARSVPADAHSPADPTLVTKDPKVNVPSLVVKGGTKVKNIRLVDGDHDIDCKIDSIGAMSLKSQFVRKA